MRKTAEEVSEILVCRLASEVDYDASGPAANLYIRLGPFDSDSIFVVVHRPTRTFEAGFVTTLTSFVASLSSLLIGLAECESLEATRDDIERPIYRYQPNKRAMSSLVRTRVES